MGKGALDYADPRALGTVGLQSRDYALAGFEDADVVIAMGYDLVEHAPKHWNPRRDKKIVVVDSEPAEIDEFFTPEVELVGDIYHVITRLAEECRDVPHSGGSQRLRDIVLGRLEAAREDDAFPVSRRARCGRSARRWAARTCSSPTSACTSCGSGGCSRRTSRTPC
jgi:acetolactate synthase-1/2/3 large subunit